MRDWVTRCFHKGITAYWLDQLLDGLDLRLHALLLALLAGFIAGASVAVWVLRNVLRMN